MNLYGKVGHKGWFLATRCGRRRGVEFCLCSAPEPRATDLPSGPNLTPNGVDRVTPIFLRGIGNGTGMAQDYCETKMGSLPPHKFTHYVIGNKAYEDLPERDETGNLF